ncbi:MAG: hypothetical protein ABIN89_07540 [Chitinophagaceae bacterium]
MSKNKLTRRDFVVKSTVNLIGAAISTSVPATMVNKALPESTHPAAANQADDAFADEVKKLPVEEPYHYHKQLSEGPVHIKRRDGTIKPLANEILVDERWKIIVKTGNSIILKNATQDFQEYLDKSMGTRVEIVELNSLKKLPTSIIVGTREQLPGFGLQLKGSKDYEIIVTPQSSVIICGYDEKGAMFGLYNLEARMNFREAPIILKGLKTTRHSLFDTRMVLSWMGWMEWPDTLLSHLAHDGYDGIFASVYANPTGDRTTAENSTEFYARLLFKVRGQDPKVIHELIHRAARFGIKVYTPIVYQYLDTPESETGLRNLVRAIVKEFPGIKGYVLLTEGFYYKEWRAGHADEEDKIREWARKWSKAVAMVEEECHKVDPAIEILPWEYNIDFRPQKTELKRYFIQQLPKGTIPLLTWENGKGFEIDGMKGYLRDYSLSQIGPAEVTNGQIAEARSRNMKVYCKVDTFASWQYGTLPYLPVPNQWFDRYNALEKYKVNGTLESWSSGYKPNFISELRAWTCWTDAPPMESLLNGMAKRIFGDAGSSKAVEAWKYFSEAIRLVPDTGPNMGTNNAVGNPIFFQVPPLRTATFIHSWTDFEKWLGYFGSELNPYWPFTVSRMVFYPDFTNKINKAEQYARSATGIEAGKETEVLPVFLKYLKQAADKMEQGLKLYREAALASSASKREQAVREVIVAEHLQRMMLSDFAILEFESLRLKVATATGNNASLYEKMESILRQEIRRTELSLLAATRDSRLGFQFEQDYVYTPYSLKEKLAVLKDTLDNQLPAAQKKG